MLQLLSRNSAAQFRFGHTWRCLPPDCKGHLSGLHGPRPDRIKTGGGKNTRERKAVLTFLVNFNVSGGLSNLSGDNNQVAAAAQAAHNTTLIYSAIQRRKNNL